MIVIYIILAVITAVVIAYGVHNAVRADELDEFEEELHKFSIHLDERANNLAAGEETVRRLYKELREELNKRKDETGNN